jgi:soluble lytic murein transglycosylase-like protein
MTAPRRVTAALIALGMLGLSGGVNPPSGDSAASLDSFSDSAFESSEAAYTAAKVLGDLHTGLLPAELSRVSVAIAAESSRAELPIELVLALIQVESSGYNFAVSPVGAMGLMQVMPATAEEVADRIGLRWVGPAALFDPVTNVQIGVVYLRELLDRYKNVAVALAAYNWGPTRIAERLRQGEPVPALYARRVLSVYQAAMLEPLQI